MASDVGHFFIYGPPMLLKCQRLVVQLLIGSFYFPAGPCPKNKGQEHGKIETQMTWGGGKVVPYPWASPQALKVFLGQLTWMGEAGAGDLDAR